MLNTKDETQNNISDEVSELSVPGTHFDRQIYTHLMMRGETTQTNQVPELPTGGKSPPREPPSEQHQNQSTKISRDKILPLVEHTPRNQNSNTSNSINRLLEAIAGFVTQQRLQTATISIHNHNSF